MGFDQSFIALALAVASLALGIKLMRKFHDRTIGFFLIVLCVLFLLWEVSPI